MGWTRLTEVPSLSAELNNSKIKTLWFCPFHLTGVWEPNNCFLARKTIKSLYIDMKEELMVVQEYLFVRICAPDVFSVASNQTSIASCYCFQPILIQMHSLEGDLKPHQMLMGIFLQSTIRFLGLLCVSLGTDVLQKLLSFYLTVYLFMLWYGYVHFPITSSLFVL